MSTFTEIERAVDVARRAVKAAGDAALRHFRAGVRVETKPDRSPVTAADREAEAAVLALLRADFPDHAILGEETGEHAGMAGLRWIVDPIDGTRGFTRGGPFWGPLVALQHDGRVVAGAMALPVLGTTYWAGRGLGAFRDGERLHVSGIAAWEHATLSLGEMRDLLGRPSIVDLARAAASARCYGDLAGCAMLLDGRADAWIEGGVKPWDLAPLQILVEEAGGRFTDFAGTPTVETGNAVATNGPLHDHVLRALRG
jgi:histidinol-phosphatase